MWCAYGFLFHESSGSKTTLLQRLMRWFCSWASAAPSTVIIHSSLDRAHRCNYISHNIVLRVSMTDSIVFAAVLFWKKTKNKFKSLSFTARNVCWTHQTLWVQDCLGSSEDYGQLKQYGKSYNSTEFWIQTEKSQMRMELISLCQYLCLFCWMDIL